MDSARVTLVRSGGPDQRPAAVAPAGAHTGHRATERSLSRLIRAIAPLFLSTSIFSDHPEFRFDLSDTPRDAVKTHFLVRITLLNLSQCKQALNMFQNFAPLIFNHVADHRGKIIYAKVGEADPFGSPVKSHTIILNLSRAIGFDALLHAANMFGDVHIGNYSPIPKPRC